NVQNTCKSPVAKEIATNTEPLRTPADVVACVQSLNCPTPKSRAVWPLLLSIHFSTCYAQVVLYRSVSLLGALQTIRSHFSRYSRGTSALPHFRWVELDRLNLNLSFTNRKSRHTICRNSNTGYPEVPNVISRRKMVVGLVTYPLNLTISQTTQSGT